MPHFFFALFLFLAKREELDVTKRELEVHIEKGRKKSERDKTEAKRKRRYSRLRAEKLRAKAVHKYQSKVTESPCETRCPKPLVCTVTMCTSEQGFLKDVSQR